MTALSTLLGRAQQTTTRVCSELRNTQLVWANFEAIYGIEGAPRDQFAERVYSLGLGNTLHSLRIALVRDTLMSLFRVTDPPNTDRLTFCRLSRLLGDEALRENRKEAARNWIASSYPELREKDALTCASSMQAITDAVPPLWNKSAPPVDSRLFDLRTKLGPLRKGSLAHALDKSDGNVAIGEIRSFIKVTSELAQHAELVLTEAAPSWDLGWRIRLKEANEFWDCCQKGL